MDQNSFVLQESAEGYRFTDGAEKHSNIFTNLLDGIDILKQFSKEVAMYFPNQANLFEELANLPEEKLSFAPHKFPTDELPQLKKAISDAKIAWRETKNAYSAPPNTVYGFECTCGQFHAWLVIEGKSPILVDSAEMAYFCINYLVENKEITDDTANILREAVANEKRLPNFAMTEVIVFTAIPWSGDMPQA